jgi:hypothetical protein
MQEIEAAGVELTLPSNASRLKLFTVTISDCGLLTPDVTPLYVFLPRKAPVGGFPPPPGSAAAAPVAANTDLPKPPALARDEAAATFQLSEQSQFEDDCVGTTDAKAQSQRSPATPLGTHAESETATFRFARQGQRHAGNHVDAPSYVSRDPGPRACTEEEFSLLRRVLHDVISTIPVQQVQNGACI